MTQLLNLVLGQTNLGCRRSVTVSDTKELPGSIKVTKPGLCQERENTGGTKTEYWIRVPSNVAEERSIWKLGGMDRAGGINSCAVDAFAERSDLDAGKLMQKDAGTRATSDEVLVDLGPNAAALAWPEPEGSQSPQSRLASLSSRFG